VIAPDHSYDANITIFPDGSIADYRSVITGHPDSISIRKMQMETRFKDVQFILDQLEKIQDGRLQLEITGKMDLGKIAVGGHSYGGSTATVAAHGDNRIKACFVLDSWISPVPQQTIDAGVHVPFLFMGRPTWEGSDYPGNYPRLDNLMAHSSNPKYRLIIKETEHLDFSDIPLFSPIIGWVMDVGSLPAKVSTSLLNELVYGFLEKHLLKQGNVNFDKMINHDLIYQIQ
jgi:pimeloyl-ACP methyl ester carboxylesterase